MNSRVKAAVCHKPGSFAQGMDSNADSGKLFTEILLNRVTKQTQGGRLRGKEITEVTRRRLTLDLRRGVWRQGKEELGGLCKETEKQLLSRG